MYSVRFKRGGAGDDVYRVRAAGQAPIDAALGEGLPVQPDQRLRLAEPRALPRGQQIPATDVRTVPKRMRRPTLIASIRDVEW